MMGSFTVERGLRESSSVPGRGYEGSGWVVYSR